VSALHPFSSNRRSAQHCALVVVSVGLSGSREAPGGEAAEQRDGDRQDRQPPMSVDQLHRYH
jgi:hypothetical protein